MKKVLALLLAAILVFSFAACAGSKDDTTTSAGDSSSAPASDSSSAANTDVDYSKVKAGFIFLHDENSTYDKNFIEAAKAACEKLGIEYVFKTNVPEEGDKCYQEAADLADSGCNIVFADSFGHEDNLIRAAKEFPNVQFCHSTGVKAHTEGLKNYHNAFASIYEGRYLAGIAAGLKLKEMIDSKKITEDQAKMGYVGAYTYAEVISGYTSFYLGAKSVVPSVTMEVQFTGSWYDETKEKEAATTLIKDGCVLISQHADSMGAPTACENAKVPNVSYNGSTEKACPNTFIVSSRINWEPYYEYAFGCIAKGEEIQTDWTGTLKTGSVVLTDVNETAAAKDTQKTIDEVKAKLESGELHVFDTKNFTVGGKTLDSYKADVDSDKDNTGDTEVITDGIFNESEKRSAPYFDLRIDGIKLLNEKY